MSAKIYPITMPKWGMTMEEGIVTSWLVNEGEIVNLGDELAEIETEKLANVVESQASGILMRHLVNEGDTYAVGSLLGIIVDGEVSEQEISLFIQNFSSKQIIEKDRLQNANSNKTIKVGNIELSFLELGPDDTETQGLVFVHGFGGDLSSWNLNQTGLSGTFRTLAFDLPGHGSSGLQVSTGSVTELANKLLLAIEKKKFGPIHLVGHSLGGAIALMMALQKPKFIKTISLICPVYNGCNVNIEFLDGFLEADSRKAMKDVLGMLYFDTKAINRKFIDETLRFKRFDGAKEALLKIRGSNFTESGEYTGKDADLKDIGVPIQIINGGNDKIVYQTSVNDLPSNVEVHEIEGTGHMPQMEQYGQVNDLIKRFVINNSG